MTYKNYMQYATIGNTDVVYSDHLSPTINTIIKGIEISIFPTTVPMLYKIDIDCSNTLYFSTQNGRLFSSDNKLHEVIMLILGEPLNELIHILKNIELFEENMRNIELKYQNIKG